MTPSLAFMAAEPNELVSGHPAPQHMSFRKRTAVRFARWFVLIVPVGMALVGLSIGDGRAAYQSATGQLWVLLAFGMMGGCGAWAGYLLRLPDEERVFIRDEVIA